MTRGASADYYVGERLWRDAPTPISYYDLPAYFNQSRLTDSAPAFLDN
jgi:hypothetical protein